MLIPLLVLIGYAQASQAGDAWFQSPLKNFEKAVNKACKAEFKITLDFDPEKIPDKRRSFLLSNLKALEKSVTELCLKHQRFPTDTKLVLKDKIPSGTGTVEDDFTDGKNGFALGSSNFKKEIGSDAALSLQFLLAKKWVLILKSTKNYREALEAATKAAKDFHLKLDLRELEPNEKTGLTWGEMACGEAGASYPCYFSRAREPSGKYMSIEHSNAFKGLEEGFYIVVAGISDKRNAGFKAAELAKIKRKIPDSYIKNTFVYIGCIH